MTVYANILKNSNDKNIKKRFYREDQKSSSITYPDTVNLKVLSVTPLTVQFCFLIEKSDISYNVVASLFSRYSTVETIFNNEIQLLYYVPDVII